MSISFSHKVRKQSIFYNDLVPGRSMTDFDTSMGRTGKTGKNGPSIYFTDYTPDDDFVKGILLEKISQNLVLSSDSDQRLVGIEYTAGDIIITKKKYAYKIVDSGGEFDLEFMGEFVQPPNTISEQDKLLESIIGVEFADFTIESMKIRSISNRSMDSSENLSAQTVKYDGISHGYNDTDLDSSTDVSTNYENALHYVLGFSFKPIIRIDTTINNDVYNNYDFYLKIYMKNTKSYQGYAYTINNEYVTDFINPSITDPVNYDCYNVFDFYKYSEIPLRSIMDDSVLPTNTQTVYISDMTCDKLHPSGNNIVSNAIDSQKSISTNYGIRYLGSINKIRFEGLTGGLEKYNGTAGVEKNRSDILWKDQVASFDKLMFRDSSYVNTMGIVQKSIRKSNDDMSIEKYVPNFRAGDSAYFSGMTLAEFDSTCFKNSSGVIGQHYVQFHINDSMVNSKSTQMQYVNHINSIKDSSIYDGDSKDTSIFWKTRRTKENDYVAGEIKNFYLNKNNIYELVCVNKKTGRVFTRIITRNNIKI